MDTSLPRRPGSRGGPGASPPRRHAADLGPIPGVAEAGPSRSRIGTSRWRIWSRRRIGLLLLGLAVLPWLPISGPLGVDIPARRVRGVGESPILSLAFAPDGATIATIQMGGHVALRAAAGGPGAHAFLDYPGDAGPPAFAIGDRSLAVEGAGSDILLYDLATGERRRALGMPIRDVRGLAFSPDGRTLAASSAHDHEIVLWDLAAGRERTRLRGHESPVLRLAFAPDGRSLASGGQGDRMIVLWDLAAGRPRRRLTVPPGPIACLAYSPDGRWLASAGHWERPVRLWDLEGRGGDRLIGSQSSAREPLAFSPDGRLLATAGADGFVRLWDLATGAELRRVGGPDDGLRGVAFSPDGRTLAATGTDADIRLWDPADLLASGPGPSWE
jgi:WD40 repeat protein